MKQKCTFSGRTAVLMIFSVFMVFWGLTGVVYSVGNPSTPSSLPGSSFTICTGAVQLASCFSPSTSPARLNWTYSSPTSYGQLAFWVQVDNNSNFSWPEVNTGWVFSPTSNNYYDVPAGVLNASTQYYWRMAAADTNDSWSGWTSADTFFTTPALCNNPPLADNLSVIKGDYCSVPSHYFSWTYSDQDGDNQSQFRFQVDDKSNFADCDDGNPATLCVDRTVSGLNNPSPSTNDQPVIVAVSPGADQLGYNSNYYWRVRVWDSQGGDSGWRYPPTGGTTPPGESFATLLHSYPSPNFTPSPQNPAIAEIVTFIDNSKCYSSPGNTEYSCSAEGSISYLWNFGNGQTSTKKGNATTTYATAGPKTVRLTITDNSLTPAGSCDTTRQVNTSLPSPDWKEIAPF